MNKEQAIPIDTDTDSDDELPVRESLSEPLSQFFKLVTQTEATCNKCSRKIKFSTKATSNLLTHLKRCSPDLYPKYANLKKQHQKVKSNQVNQPSINTFFQVA